VKNPLHVQTDVEFLVIHVHEYEEYAIQRPVRITLLCKLAQKQTAVWPSVNLLSLRPALMMLMMD
jgi:hypothetical protein